MKQSLGVWVFCLLGLWACEQEERELADGEVVRSLSKIVLQEVQTLDAIPVTLTQTYLYEENARLVSYQMKQQYAAVEPEELTGGLTLTYHDREVTVKDEIGNEWVYAWNAELQAADACVYRSIGGSVRSYVFTYSGVAGKTYLSGVTEYLEDAGQPFAMLEIDYSNPEYPLVTKRMYEEVQQFRFDCSLADGVPNPAQLPVHFYTELYPLSFHHAALYARLLGDAPDVLPRCVQTLGSPYQEQCTYEYQLKNHLPVSCKIVHSEWGTRTVSYLLEE